MIMKIKDFLIPICILILFFVIQAQGLVGELGLTVLTIIAIAITWILLYRKGEFLLLFLGVLIGSIVEIGLRYFGFQQVWNNASLFGVPYWLPIVWGFGFVVITRLGIFLTVK
jgi:hypothetical protein